jgi:voltage-gated potassium channel
MSKLNKDVVYNPSGQVSVLKGVLLLILVLMFGILGYMALEKWTFLEALYMTVITITTVGFGEVRHVSQGGRVFTVFLIFMGMGIMAYTVGMIASLMVDLQISSILGRRKLGSKIKNLKNHYIICGFGRIGSIIAKELNANKIPFIVLDNNPDHKHDLESQDIPYILDDATIEEVLIEAGIEKAKGLVAVVLSDADNLFITMTARGLNPQLFILSRADSEATQKKLIRAGASRVVMPYLIGGQKMAHTITRPAVTEFLEFTTHNKDIELRMEELLVGKHSRLVGATLVESGIRQDLNVIVVAIRKKDGDMKFNPDSQARIEEGDTLIALGHGDDLERLASILEGK